MLFDDNSYIPQRWDVEDGSFIETYGNRILMAQSEKNKRELSLEEQIIFRIKVEQILKRILVQQEWLNLLQNEDLNWGKQRKIARQLSLGFWELYGLAYRCEILGFKYYEYHAIKFPKNVDIHDMPVALNIQEDGVVQKVGNTIYSDNDLKRIMDQHNEYYAMVLRKGEMWHAFYLTTASVEGREQGSIGKHLHYTSSMAGIKLVDFAEQARACNYRIANEHIKYDDDPTYNY